jgi:hypothetical protein
MLLQVERKPGCESDIPQIRQTGSEIGSIRCWQSGHQQNPFRLQPPQTGGKSQSRLPNSQWLSRYIRDTPFFQSSYWKYFSDPANLKAAGVKRTIIRAGNINSPIGKIIFIGALWACSSAYWRRLTRIWSD